MKRVTLLLTLASFGVACGPPPSTEPPTSTRCEGAEYLAFDPTHHAPQDLRLQKIDEMLALFAEAEAAPATAAEKANQVLTLYQDAGANIAAKVAGRKDLHFTDARADVGPKLDATVRAAIAELGAATTAQQVKIAKQKLEKAGMSRWLYLSVIEELYKPSYKHYDEAYGYLGTGPTNAEAGRKSFARIATKRDGNNGTTLAAELFALVIDGSCAIENALTAKGAQEMAKDDDSAYAGLVQAMDDKLLLVVAYSVGHELIELDAKRADTNAATVKLYEGEGYFQILEPYLTGSKAPLGAELRAAFDAAIAKDKAGDTGWVSTFDAPGLLQKLEAAFAIGVKA